MYFSQRNDKRHTIMIGLEKFDNLFQGQRNLQAVPERAEMG